MQLFTFFAAACDKNQTFFGLPVWYKYLDTGTDGIGNCAIRIDGMSDYLLIGFGVIDILLRLVGLVAFGYVIYGGFLYLTSQGEPDRTKAALGTLLNAVIGIVIAMFAAAIVSFIGNRLGA